MFKYNSCDIQQPFHYFDHSNIKANQIPSNSKIPISRVDPQSIYCRLSVFWCDSECVGSALMLSASLGFCCVAPCQDITGSLKQGSVSLGHRLMTDLLPSTLSVGLFIKGKIILSQNRQVLFLSRWKLRKKNICLVMISNLKENGSHDGPWRCVMWHVDTWLIKNGLGRKFEPGTPPHTISATEDGD